MTWKFHLLRLRGKPQEKHVTRWGFPYRTPEPLVSELFLDDRPERLERLCARDEPSIHEEGRRGVDAELVAGGVIVLNRLRKLAGVETLVEGSGIEPQVGGKLLQVGIRKRALILENLVVVFPELALGVSAEGRFGGRRGLRVIGEREIAVDESNFVTVRGFDLLKGRTDPCAERSLKVRVFDDGDLGILRSSCALVARDHDRHPWGL